MRKLFRIGITGHRILPDNDHAAQSAGRVVDLIYRTNTSKDRNLAFVILSPLAEGADRLVVREVLARPYSQLEAILPLEVDDYVRDFTSSESQQEFRDLLDKASSIRVLPMRDLRAESYDAAGKYIVDHCDILIALWDGKSGRGKGGTADVVAYARKQSKPLYWINTAEKGSIISENIA